MKSDKSEYDLADFLLFVSNCLLNGEALIHAYSCIKHSGDHRKVLA
jgi:hypothetical protein